MPIHDWTRVSAGTWHDFHLTWTAELRNALNDGRLPPDYYAQAEQIAGPMGPDVLTLQETGGSPNGTPAAYPTDGDAGGVAVATAPPRTRHAEEAVMNDYVLKRRTIIVRHNSGDRIVALLEIVSPGNKGGQSAIDTFVEKAQEALFRGYHLMVLDLFPPGPRDPKGIHSLIWRGFSETAVELAADEPLALLAYSAGPSKKAYIEPTAVGHALIEMPLFLTPEMYVNVPLEETYMAAYRGVPRKWKAVLDAPTAG